MTDEQNEDFFFIQVQYQSFQVYIVRKALETKITLPW